MLWFRALNARCSPRLRGERVPELESDDFENDLRSC